jgi:MazG family protein
MRRMAAFADLPVERENVKAKETGSQLPLQRLAEIVKLLRSEEGCPWDREQSLKTVRQFVLEEAYEVADAIDSGSNEQIKTELGDLLLQVFLLSQIAADEGLFGIDEVAEAITEKLIRRHPHVFGDTVVSGTQDVLRNWEQIKADERQAEGEKAPLSVLKGVPKILPALMRAEKVSRKAARAGFDWPDADSVLQKVEEETEEVKASLSGESDAVTAELGDLLFAVVNLARKKEIDPEAALNRATERFAARFDALSREVARTGKRILDLESQELDAIWELIKCPQRPPKA